MSLPGFMVRAACAGLLFAALGVASNQVWPDPPGIAGAAGTASASGLAASADASPQNGSRRHIDPGGPNGADRYRPVFAQLEQRVSGFGRFNPRHPESIEEFAACHPDLVHQIAEATAIPRCDWNLDLNLGPFAPLEHLKPMRIAAYVMAADARTRAAAGDGLGAARSAGAVLRLAGHMGQDGTRISSLVSAWMIERVAEVINDAIDAGRLDARSRASLRAEIEAMDPSDPCAFTASIRGERRMLVSWLRRSLASGEGARAAERELADVSSADQFMQMTREIRDAVASGSAEATIARVEAALGAVEDAWTAPDAATRLEETEGRIQRGEFGPFAACFASGMSKVREKHDAAVWTLDGLRRRLTISQSGAPRMSPGY